MDSKQNHHTKSVCADLDSSWHIPRPTLARSTKSSEGSSSNNSTHSARSGSMLLTAANLAQIHNNGKSEPTASPLATSLGHRDQNLQYYISNAAAYNPLTSFAPVNASSVLPKKPTEPDPDSLSIASSTHFTVVNMNTRTTVSKRSFCRKHQLTILVVTMSALFTCGILAAILLMELRARRHQY